MTNDEIDRLIVGEVLRTTSGDYRVVRYVNTGPLRGKYANRSYYFGFAIRQCSWTWRGDTVKTRFELAAWSRVGVRVKLHSELDQLLYEDLTSIRNNPNLTCCDVRALP